MKRNSEVERRLLYSSVGVLEAIAACGELKCSLERERGRGC